MSNMNNDERPKSRLPDGRLNPDWRKWYRKQRPDIVANWNHSEAGKKARDKYKATHTRKRRQKKVVAMKANGFLRRKIASMLSEGWSQDTIVMVLQVPQSVVKDVAEAATD